MPVSPFTLSNLSSLTPFQIAVIGVFTYDWATQEGWEAPADSARCMADWVDGWAGNLVECYQISYDRGRFSKTRIDMPKSLTMREALAFIEAFCALYAPDEKVA